MKMKKIYFIALFLLAFTLPACDLLDGEDESAQSKTTPPKEAQAQKPESKEPPPTIDIIFEAKRVESKTFVANIEAGDIVTMQIAGVERRPFFSSVQKRTFPSYWKVLWCWDSPCSDYIPKEGVCTALYRDYLGEVKADVEFKKHPKEIPINFKIGDSFYPIGNIENHEGNSISTRFEVTEAMLKAGSKELFLFPVHTFREEVKTGLLKFLSCDGRDQERFRFDGPIGAEIVIDEVRRSFQIDLQKIKKNS